MNYLVVDIGNTLTKICIINLKFKIIKIYQIQTAKLYSQIFLKNFFRKVLKNNIKNKILFSSVVPKVFNKIKSFLKTKNLKSYEIKELNLKKLVKINIENYNQLGSDRIANAIGSFYEHKKNCLVIDFGTATTFDIIKKPGSYEGGVIAPGVNLSINNLHKSTASLPFFNLNFTTDELTFGLGINTFGDTSKHFLNIEVTLFANFTNIEFVYLIQHSFKEERNLIEQSLVQ